MHVFLGVRISTEVWSACQKLHLYRKLVLSLTETINHSQFPSEGCELMGPFPFYARILTLLCISCCVQRVLVLGT